MHKLIELINVSLEFGTKCCFKNVNASIYAGQKIAIIGRNGCGKSSLLRLLTGQITPTTGKINIQAHLVVGYVPQIIDDFPDMSGAQRFLKSLTQAIALRPDLLLLDEPTNHLDRENKTALIRALQKFDGTLIMATHDHELIDTSTQIIWHIENEKIHVTTQSYAEYTKSLRQQRAKIENQITALNQQKQEQHHKLMQEQLRASKKKAYGEKKYNDSKIALRGAQARGQNTTNKNRANITEHKSDLIEQLQGLRLPEIILPKFSLSGAVAKNSTILSVRDGSCGYSEDKAILQGLSFSLLGNARMAITGRNGCGKSTLFKAMLQDTKVWKTGQWHLPKTADIGYLDQHYATLNPENTVLESVQDFVSSLEHNELRKHLNTFLFRTNEQVNTKVKTLSGGEKARLSLAIIAANTPKLLLLDEITNNIDMETKDHIVQVLRNFPAAMLVISHDQEFLDNLGITDYFKL